MDEKKVRIVYDWEQSIDVIIPDTKLLKKILSKFYVFFINDSYSEFLIDRDEIEYFLSVIVNHNHRELLNENENDQIDSLDLGLKTIDARIEFSMKRVSKAKKKEIILDTIIMFQIFENPEGITIEELRQYLIGLIDSPISEITQLIKILYLIGEIYVPKSSNKRYKYTGKLPSVSQIKNKNPNLYFSLHKIQAEI